MATRAWAAFRRPAGAADVRSARGPRRPIARRPAAV